MQKENTRVYFGSTQPVMAPVHLCPSDKRTHQERTISPEGVYMGVCESASSWNKISVAKNLNDETVQVASFIEVDDRIINQYFYETKCENKHNPCAALDKTKYHSKCNDKFSYEYAIVIKEGVSILDFIKIATSCNCAYIRSINKERYFRILLGPGK